MEQFDSKRDYSVADKIDNLKDVFGDIGTDRLMSQISHDNPTLTGEEVVEQARSLIPEATAYALPAWQADLAEAAIGIHERYEAFRRIQD